MKNLRTVLHAIREDPAGALMVTMLLAGAAIVLEQWLRWLIKALDLC